MVGIYNIFSYIIYTLKKYIVQTLFCTGRMAAGRDGLDECMARKNKES